MNRYLVPLIIFSILIFALWIGLDPDRNLSDLPSPLIDKPAPEFDLPSLTDETQRVSSASLGNKMALVNIWATWCVGCRQEHGFLNELAESGQIPIYGINWRDQRPAALEWLRQLGDPYAASGYDEDGRVGIDWGVYGAPETFLIAADGTVLFKQLGPLDWALWERNFIPLIEAMEQAQ